MYYIPVVLFVLWGLYGLRTLPSLRDPAIVRRPESPVWSLPRFLRDDEWTELGQRARWQYVRYAGIGLGIGVVAIIVVSVVDRSF